MQFFLTMFYKTALLVRQGFPNRRMKITSVLISSKNEMREASLPIYIVHYNRLITVFGMYSSKSDTDGKNITL